MKYNRVNLVDNHTNTSYCATLQIDDKLYTYYTFLFGRTGLLSDNNYMVVALNITIPLNMDNPKETIDKFFKLLVLQ
jgi:hypothetical protein